MKILYDHQIFETQIHGGISRYFYEIIKGIESSYKDVDYLLPIINSSNHYIRGISSLASGVKAGSDYYNQFLKGVEFPGKWRLFKYWTKIFPNFIEQNKRNAIEAISKCNYDLFHPTDLDDYFLKYIGNRPFVITIHDMIDELFPEYSFHVYSKYKTSVKENLVKKATGIITVSESTKKDLLQRFEVDEKKVTVIHHGVSALVNDEELISRPVVEGIYFLYVGKRVHYKNFYFFLQALQPILIKDLSIKLVCVGTPFNKDELNYFNDLKVSDSLIHIKANDSLLAILYRNALAFVYPSLYEGFGIPILESFKYGCPVILSNSSSFLEVADDAGLYFNPKDIDSIQQAVLTILSDQYKREELIMKGYKRLNQFSWNKTIEETVKFYKNII